MKKLGWKTIWWGWGLFLISLLMPAVKLDWGAWDQADASFAWGFGCALWFPYFYPSNVLSLCAPLLSRLFKGWRKTRVFLALLFVASAIGGLCCLPMFRAVHVGYVMWILSFAVLAGGFFTRKPCCS